jgi:hypothetical protein
LQKKGRENLIGGEKHAMKEPARQTDKAKIGWEFCQGRRCQGVGSDEMIGDQAVK